MSKTTVLVTSRFNAPKGITVEQKAEFTTDATFDVVNICVRNKVGNRRDHTVTASAEESMVYVTLEPGLAYPLAEELYDAVTVMKEQVDAIVDTDPNRPYHTEEPLDRYRTQASHADI